MSESDSGEAFDFKLYRYTPSLVAAIIGVTVFAILTSLHTWKLVRRRALYFTAFTIGGLFETVGYAGRIWSHYDPLSIGGFVIQAILILIAPALFAASIYMILGRLVRTLRADRFSIFAPALVTKVFVTGDVLSFTLQAGGGGIQAGGTLNLYNIGEKIIVVGLFIQVTFFSFFLLTTLIFHRRFAHAAHLSTNIGKAIPWRRHLYVLYTTSALILIRSVFRIVEYLQGNDGYLIRYEVFLYVFDLLLMAATMLVFLIWYVDDLEALKRDARKRGHLSSDSDVIMLEDGR